MKRRAVLMGVLVLAVFGAGGAGAEAARIVTGTVEDINARDNKMTLSRRNEKGELEKLAFKWKENIQGFQALENAQVGSQLTLEANDSLGGWEIARVITDPSQPAASAPAESSPQAATQGAKGTY